jgi:hypothetical protein
MPVDRDYKDLIGLVGIRNLRVCAHTLSMDRSTQGLPGVNARNSAPVRWGSRLFMDTKLHETGHSFRISYRVYAFRSYIFHTKRRILTERFGLFLRKGVFCGKGLRSASFRISFNYGMDIKE